MQLKEKRDAAILEKHKEGMSGRKIAELFKMGQRTVADIIAAVSENADSVKPLTPEVSPSVVPRMTLRLSERKSGIPKTAHPCVYLSENPESGNPLTPASA